MPCLLYTHRVLFFNMTASHAIALHSQRLFLKQKLFEYFNHGLLNHQIYHRLKMFGKCWNVASCNNIQKQKKVYGICWKRVLWYHKLKKYQLIQFNTRTHIFSSTSKRWPYQVCTDPIQFSNKIYFYVVILSWVFLIELIWKM